LDEISTIIKNDPSILNKQNEKGWTALMLACCNINRESSEEIVKCLLDAGANIYLRNSEGQTALMLLCHNTMKSTETAELLIDTAQPQKCSYYINLQDNHGMSTLMFVCKYRSWLYDNVDLMELLIKYNNIDLNLKNSKNETALLLTYKEYYKQFELLVNAGADLDIQYDGLTILMLICKDLNVRDHIKKIKLLINNRCNLDMQNNEGNSALMLACKHGDTDTMKLLIDSGCDINLQNNYGQSVLMLTAGSIRKTKLLIDAGYDLNLKNNHGNTMLMLLCAAYEAYPSSYDIAELLIEAGCDLNIKNNNGRTALMLACGGYSPYSIPPYISLLVKNGCDLTIKDNRGKMAHELYNNRNTKYLLNIFKNNKIRTNSLIDVCSKYITDNQSYYFKIFLTVSVHEDIAKHIRNFL